LREFDVEASSNFPPNRTKNLNLAHQLAAEQYPLSHWKDVLAEFQESVHKAAEEEMARKLAKEEKEKKKAAKKSTKSVEEGDDDDDTAMDLGPDAAAEPKKKKPAKKRELVEGDSKDVRYYDIQSLQFITNVFLDSCNQKVQANFLLEIYQRYSCLVCKAKIREERICRQAKESRKAKGGSS